MRTSLLLICAILLCALPRATQAQHDEVQSLAHRVAIELTATGLKRVAIAGFAGPGDGMTQLGKVLSQEFAASLSWTDRGFDTNLTPLLQRVLNENGVTLKEQTDRRVVRSLGERTGAEIIVLGSIVREGIRVILRVHAFRAADGIRIAEGETQIPETQAVDALIAKPLLLVQSTPPPGARCDLYGPGVFTPGRDGVSQPKCTQCPNPSYTEEASKGKVSGFVLVRFLVTDKGTAERVEVMNRPGEPPLGHGLEQRAVDAVRDWKFQPATSREGKAVNSCLTAEIIFRIK